MIIPLFLATALASFAEIDLIADFLLFSYSFCKSSVWAANFPAL
jgi:hypothetical protein